MNLPSAHAHRVGYSSSRPRTSSILACVSAIGMIFLAYTSSFASPAEEEVGLVVEGFASISIPATELEVVFELPIGGSSFEGSLHDAEALQRRMRSTLQPEDFPSFEVSLDLAMFRQRALAWRKGKRIEHRFIVKIKGVEPNHVLTKAARLLDTILPLDPELTVAAIRSFPPKDAVLSGQQRAMAIATADARQRAEVLARAAEVQLGPLLSIAPTRVPEHRGYALEERIFLGANFREPFEISADLVREVRVTAAVTARYAIRQ